MKYLLVYLLDIPAIVIKKTKLIIIGEDLQIHLISDILKTIIMVFIFSVILVQVSNLNK